MKSLTTTTTGNLFNLEGILTHAGEYAGRYTEEADAILESVSERRSDIYDNGVGWSDVMFNKSASKVYAVWASDELTAQNGLLQYIELDEKDCPEAFATAKEKIADL